MKHILATVTGACLLLTSAGIVLADNVHVLTPGTKTTGQPGAIGGITCGMTTGSRPAGTAGGAGSPFNTADTDKRYAGNAGNPTGPGGNANNGNVANNSPNAVSEYDVACFQSQHVP
jgi:hypothetical protein